MKGYIFVFVLSSLIIFSKGANTWPWLYIHTYISNTFYLKNVTFLLELRVYISQLFFSELCICMQSGQVFKNGGWD